VLLIAAVLSPQEVKSLATLAKKLGLEALLEVHNSDELKSHACPEVSLIGVNNRDLNDFSVDVGISLAQAEQIPSEFLKVAESGIADPATLLNLRRAGYRGFLIGEAFMQSSKPEVACKRFIEAVRSGD
jgi:indole-3-glycerol phosphate synthase